MINQVEKKNPNRRFKEFLGKENWNVHTLGTVLMSMYNGQTPSRSKGEYWNGKINWLTSGELNCGIVNDTFEKITELGLDSANLKIIPKGILVIAITGLEASGTRGNCAILGCNTTLNQSCMALFPIRSLISSDFLFNWYLFIGDYYGIKYTQGTKQQSYNSKILNDLEIVIPSLDEQNKISSFFSKLDSMINFQKRKLDKLQATKKALLQEMFPEEGQDKPKRRFKGFTDAWEQRKFGDLFEYERPDAYIVKSDNYNNDFNMPVLTANKAFILGYTNEENSYNKPSIIFDDFTLDRKYVDFPYMLKSSAIKILTSKNQHNLRFLFERLNSTRFVVLGHARHYISVVQNTTTLCPSVDEEVCISNLLTKFDELITLHQRKLDKLKNLKQAYLNEMFV